MEQFIEAIVNGFNFFLDNYYAATFLVLGTVLFAMLAGANVRLTFSRYEKIRSSSGIPAHIIARKILDRNGLSHVRVEHTGGNLTDHYDPRNEVVVLSDSTYNSTSVAAIGIAAHECGHAIQHMQAYLPIKIRSAIYPAVNIANRTWMLVILVGMFVQLTGMIYVGIVFFALSTLFSLVTLPVEFNASRRAMETIEFNNILDKPEQTGARKVLSAAAMTYVAALLVSLAQLIRILVIARRRN